MQSSCILLKKTRCEISQIDPLSLPEKNDLPNAILRLNDPVGGDGGALSKRMQHMDWINKGNVLLLMFNICLDMNVFS